MIRNRPTARPGACVISALEPRVLLAVVPAGPEFVVTAPASIGRASIASDAGGNFVIAWTAQTGGELEYDVFARRYDSAGVPLGTPFRVNTTTGGTQNEARVGVAANGSFVIGWTSRTDPWNDPWSHTAYAQRFTAAGAPVGGETFLRRGYLADLAMNGGGEILVTFGGPRADAFSDAELFVRRYTPDLTPAGDEQWVAGGPRVLGGLAALEDDGDFVVLWGEPNDFRHDGYVRRYSAADEPLTGDVLVNQRPDAVVAPRDVGVDANGHIVVTWTSWEGAGSGDFFDAYVRRFDPSGEPLGDEFRANTTTQGRQTDPVVAVDREGAFNIVWTSQPTDDPAGPGSDGAEAGIFGRSFGADGSPLGEEFLVNSAAWGPQHDPVAAPTPGGGFVAVWRSGNTSEDLRTAARRFVDADATPGVAEVYVRGSAWVPAFKAHHETRGVGDEVYGYRVDDKPPGDVLPWVNVDEVVLRYGSPPTGGGVPAPGTVTLDGDRADGDYTVSSVTQLDPQTFVLRLDRALGTLSTGDENGLRVRLSVDGAGHAGTVYTLTINALQGDVDKSGSVVASDFSDVKKKFFRSTTAPGPAGDTQYTVFHDVDGSGSIVANDFSEVKKRFFDNLPDAGAGVPNISFRALLASMSEPDANAVLSLRLDRRRVLPMLDIPESTSCPRHMPKRPLLSDQVRKAIPFV